MNLIDENFGIAFICLDKISKEITHQSLKNKIKILETIKNSVDNQLKEYKQTEKYREGIYKDFIKRG